MVSKQQVRSWGMSIILIVVLASCDQSIEAETNVKGDPSSSGIDEVFEMLANDGFTSETKTMLRSLADQGDAKAKLYLGLSYMRGSGAPEKEINEVEGIRWIQLSAEQGYPTAQIILGDFYEGGNGVPVNTVEASKWHALGIGGWGREEYVTNYRSGEIDGALDARINGCV